jgi:hypothetical protein
MSTRPWQKKPEQDEPTRIRAAHGDYLVSISKFAAPRAGAVADVRSIDDLVQMAKKYDSMIMELSGGSSTAYLLWDNGFLYRYSCGATSPVNSDDDNTKQAT